MSSLILLVDWKYAQPQTHHRMVNSKVHSVIQLTDRDVIRCRRTTIPIRANKRMGEAGEITCKQCINKLYNPKPNKLRMRRR